MCFNYLIYIYIISYIIYVYTCILSRCHFHPCSRALALDALPGHGAGRLGLFGDGAGEVAWPGSARGASFGKAMEIP